jgi:hypothetical protein
VTGVAPPQGIAVQSTGQGGGDGAANAPDTDFAPSLDTAPARTPEKSPTASRRPSPTSALTEPARETLSQANLSGGDDEWDDAGRAEQDRLFIALAGHALYQEKDLFGALFMEPGMPEEQSFPWAETAGEPYDLNMTLMWLVVVTVASELSVIAREAR